MNKHNLVKNYSIQELNSVILNDLSFNKVH